LMISLPLLLSMVFTMCITKFIEDDVASKKISSNSAELLVD